MAHAGPPFSGDPYEDKVGEKPAVRTWAVKEGKFAYVFVFEPGIPDPNQVLTVTVEPQPAERSFGARSRVEGAKLALNITDPDGKRVGRYLLHALPLSKGKYATHFTPTASGLYGLMLEGTTAEGKTMSASLKMPVDVWPLPEELEGSGAQGVATRVRAPLTK